MESLKPYMKSLLADARTDSPVIQRNRLKEYLQIVALDFICAHPVYSRLVFYGGSCLAQCHGLPRLSEDLDFVDIGKKIKLTDLARDLEEYFRGTDLKAKASVQKFRIYLKFFILEELGLAGPKESDQLFLKIEVFTGFDFCRNYRTEIRPLFKYGRSLLINTFDLPTLMSTKIRAVLRRRWEKTDKSGRILASVKGRDYFDLMWYLEKGIQPNLDCLEEIAGREELKLLLLANVAKLDERSIRADLEAFISDQAYVKKLGKNLKPILIGQINNM